MTKQTLQKFSSLFIIYLFCSFLANAQVKYHRIQARLSNEKFKEVMDAGLAIDHYHFKNDTLSAELSGEDIKLLKSKKVKIKYIIKDLEKNIHQHNAKIDKTAASAPKTRTVIVPTPSNFGIGGNYGASTAVAKHFTFLDLQNELNDMRSLYPNLISAKTSIGTSSEGRSIFMVRISDNPDVDESEPEVLMDGLHHAREPMSMTQLIFFMWHLLENYNTDKEIKQLVNSAELYVVPCVNPDGYVYNQTTNSTGGGLWRKNRRNNGGGVYGVDPNRNYDHDFGGLGTSSTPSSDIYKGPSAFSEPETQAIRNLSNAHQFITAFHNHSYGNYCIYPYSNVNVNTCPEIPLFNQLSIFLTSDNAFTYGNAYATVAYSAAGGAEDWGYAEQTTKPKTYGFTPEIGLSSDGFWPAASRIIPICNTMTVMNKNLMKVSTKFATLTSTGSTTFNTTNANLSFNIKSFCINPSTYTISINPLTPIVTNVGAAKVFSNMTMFQTLTDAFNFNVNPSIAVSTNVSFEVLIDNGLYIRKDTMNLLYNCPTPSNTTNTNITDTSATVNWSAFGGVSQYKVSYKLASTSTWGPDILVNSNSTILNGLTSNTLYHWRVKIANCTNYTNTQSFLTLPLCTIPVPNILSTSTSSFSINWPTIPSATSYNIHSRLLGTTNWTTTNVISNLFTLNGLPSGTIYEFEVSANCPGGSSVYSPTQAIATSPAPVYCGSNGINNTSEWIDYLQLETIQRTSGQETAGYKNTNMSTSLNMGSTYAIVYSAGYLQSIKKVNWNIYIDYNRDGDFTDSAEKIVSTIQSGTGNYSSLFTIPNFTSNHFGSTRMRVQMIQSNLISNNPCGSFNLGEVEDYNIKINKNSSSSKNIEISPTDENDELLVSITPNPFIDQINIVLLEDVITDETKIQLHDVRGKIVYLESLTSSKSVCQINTTHLSNGFYILTIQSRNKKKIVKLVK